MWKELHLFPVPTAKLEMFCHDRAYVLIPDEEQEAEDGVFPPFGVTEEFTL